MGAVRRPSWPLKSYSCDPKTTTTVPPTVILGSSLYFLQSWAGTNVSPAEVLERATANDYKQGAHHEENSMRNNTKCVKKTLRDQGIALRCYGK